VFVHLNVQHTKGIHIKTFYLQRRNSHNYHNTMKAKIGQTEHSRIVDLSIALCTLEKV